MSGHDLILDVATLVPGADGPDDACADRLVVALEHTPGVRSVHRTDEDGTARLCVHVDQGVVSLARVEERARAVGAELAARYGHIHAGVDPVPGHATRADTAGARLRQIVGVIDAEVTVDGEARLEWDTTMTSLDDVLAEANAAGWRLSPHRDHGAAGDVGHAAGTAGEIAEGDHDEHNHGPGEEHGHGPGDGHDHAHGRTRELTIAIVAFAIYLVARVLDWTTDSDRIPTGLYVIAALTAGYLVARDVYGSLRARRVEIDALMFVAAIGAAIIGHWPDAALLLVLFCLGHALEGYVMGRAKRAIEALAELAPPTAHRLGTDGTINEIPLDQVVVGDVLVVRPNERIAADGYVIDGTSAVDEASVTGESVPVDKQPAPGDLRAAAMSTIPAAHRLYAGSLNGTGTLRMSVVRAATDSTLANVVRLVAEAETQVSPTQQFTRRVVRIFVPAVLTLVGGLLIIPPLFGEPFRESFLRAMAVLVASSPCALAIATPSAVLAAIARAARSGVLIKGGGPLEALGKVRTIAFDKTGTLTEGRPRLVAVEPAAGVTADELLAATLAIEATSDHPLARAIVEGALVRSPSLDRLAADDVRAVIGKGITGTVADQLVEIGNAALFQPDIPPAEVTATREALEATGRTTMIVRAGGRWLGVIGVMDTPRPEAPSAIAELRRCGISEMVMLSGDQQPVATAVAASVGITTARGGLLPDDKVTEIRALAARPGGVAMVGDGVNDAPALATANVGIAMGAAGSDVALETADIALMADRLDRLPFAIELTRRAGRVIRQNLWFSLGVVAVLIPLTIVGVGIGPAVIAHEGSTLVVVANALALLAHREPKATDAASTRP